MSLGTESFNANKDSSSCKSIFTPSRAVVDHTVLSVEVEVILSQTSCFNFNFFWLSSFLRPPLLTPGNGGGGGGTPLAASLIAPLKLGDDRGGGTRLGSDMVGLL